MFLWMLKLALESTGWKPTEMNALLIHPDGRAEVVFGQIAGDLTTLAVLTQSALSALEAAAGQAGQSSIHSLQLHHEDSCITILQIPQDRWLRVEHESGASVPQVRQWAEQNVQDKAPAKPVAARVTSLADALNIAGV
jgi:hypothetical protein